MISVVTPVFNCAKDLRRCVVSVLGQTYRTWELILVDDGSTDGSGGLCDALAQTDSRISVIHGDNGGPARARNLGMERASGDFLFFLDADDYLDPDALELLAKTYREAPADWVLSGCTWIDGEGKALRQERYYAPAGPMSRETALDYLERYLREPNRTPMFTSVWGKLFDASIVRRHALRFDSSLHVFEDADFNFRYLRHARTLAYVEGYAYHYRYMAYYVSASTRVIDHPMKVLDHLPAMASLAALFQERRGGLPPEQIVGHATITLTIIQMVRLCGGAGLRDWGVVLRVIQRVVDDPTIRSCIAHYRPTSRQESRVLPALLEHRQRVAVALLCAWKAYARYGKPPGRAGWIAGLTSLRSRQPAR